MVEVREITCECDLPQVPDRTAIQEEDSGYSYVPEKLVDGLGAGDAIPESLGVLAIVRNNDRTERTNSQKQENKYFELKNSWGAPNSNYLLAIGWPLLSCHLASL